MNEILELFRDTVPTPIGALIVLTDSQGRWHAVDWTEHYADTLRRLQCRHETSRLRIQPRPPTRDRGPRAALDRYFGGELAVLDTLTVAVAGTPFQCAVWNTLRRIPAGDTITYTELAHRVGRPRAVRAAGAANGANSIGIVVPCHRVIGADGSLTGYAGGVERKRWLLEHERRHAAERTDGWKKSPTPRARTLVSARPA